MFSRLYFIIGLIAMAGFSYAQYRGVSPFDTYATTTNRSGPGGSRLGSHLYHK